MSLKQKLLILVIPLLFLVVIFGGVIVVKEFDNGNKAGFLKKRTDIFLKTSEFIHQLQIERGKSNLFVGKKISLNELSEQREKVDVLQKKIDEMISQSEKNTSLINEYSKIKVDKNSARELVQKEEAQKATSNFSTVISNLIKLQVLLFSDSNFEGIEGDLSNLTIFESSKESMGKLRAALNIVFSKNEKVTKEDVKKYYAHVNSIVSNLETPSLNISADNKTRVLAILNSSDWNEILSNLSIVEEKYSTGGYNVDAKLFSSKITTLIDSVSKIKISEQLNHLNILDSKIADSDFRLKLTVFIVLLCLILSLIFSIKTVKNLSSALEDVSINVEATSSNVSKTAVMVESGANSLSQATTEQASSLQETSSSVEEISSMIVNTKDFAHQSNTLSKETQNKSQDGRVIVNRLKNSISEVSNSNEKVLVKIGEMVDELANIQNIINEISVKTKIINDIVFQTKLLSFNASVEAARAGEHGKGFAVVAEEIGNLAKNSGEASVEITNILNQSTSLVNNIINSFKSEILQLTEISKDKISVSLSSSELCEGVFEEINTKIEEMTKMSSDIFSASEEQSRGVSEISKAITQLDHVAQLNSTSALNFNTISNDLIEQSSELNSAIKKLNDVIRGRV